jgi:OmpA-OmpF porin, OOP family
MMKKNLILASIIASSVMIPITSSAENFYVGLALGNSEYDSEGSDLDDDTTFSIKTGYKIGENFAVELAYNDFGEASESEIETGDGWSEVYKGSAENTSLSIAAVGIFPLNDNFNLHIKFGMERWDTDASVKEIYTDSDPQDSYTMSNSIDLDGNDVFYGVGVTYSFSKSIDLNLEYETHSWEDDDVELDNDNLSLGLNYNF